MGDSPRLPIQRPHEVRPLECQGCGHDWNAVFLAKVVFRIRCPKCDQPHTLEMKDAA